MVRRAALVVLSLLAVLLPASGQGSGSTDGSNVTGLPSSSESGHTNATSSEVAGTAPPSASDANDNGWRCALHSGVRAAASWARPHARALFSVVSSCSTWIVNASFSLTAPLSVTLELQSPPDSYVRPAHVRCTSWRGGFPPATPVRPAPCPPRPRAPAVPHSPAPAPHSQSSAVIYNGAVGNSRLNVSAVPLQAAASAPLLAPLTALLNSQRCLPAGGAVERPGRGGGPPFTPTDPAWLYNASLPGDSSLAPTSNSFRVPASADNAASGVRSYLVNYDRAQSASVRDAAGGLLACCNLVPVLPDLPPEFYSVVEANFGGTRLYTLVQARARARGAAGGGRSPRRAAAPRRRWGGGGAGPARRGLGGGGAVGRAVDDGQIGKIGG